MNNKQFRLNINVVSETTFLIFPSYMHAYAHKLKIFYNLHYNGVVPRKSFIIFFLIIFCENKNIDKAGTPTYLYTK